MSNDSENKLQEIIDKSLELKKQDALDSLGSAAQEIGEKLELLRIAAGAPISKEHEAPISLFGDVEDVYKGGAEQTTGAEFRRELKNFSEAVTTTIVGLHVEQHRLQIQTKKLFVIIIILALAVLGIGIFSSLRWWHGF